MSSLKNRRGEVDRNGHMNKRDLNKTMPKAIPRDDLRTAFSGDENKGPASNPKNKSSGSHQSSRRLSKDSGKTPVR
jgi:hypothetical protein